MAPPPPQKKQKTKQKQNVYSDTCTDNNSVSSNKKYCILYMRINGFNFNPTLLLQKLFFNGYLVLNRHPVFVFSFKNLF